MTADLLGDRFAIEPTEGGGRISTQPSSQAPPSRLTPFIGRKKELAFIAATIEESREETCPRVVLVVAEAGAGKTRLVQEVRGEDACDGVEVVMTRGEALAGGATLGVARDLLRQFVALAKRRPLDVTAPMTEIVAFLLEGDEGPSPVQAGPTLDRGARLSHGFSAWLHAATSVPLVVVVDDVHWMDEASARLIGDAIGALPDRAVTLIGLARPTVDETHPGLWKDHGPQRLVLGPLSERAARKLVATMMGTSADPTRVASLVARGGGQPLFLEELARAPDDEALPNTVAALVESRLAQLPESERMVVRAASLFGGEVDADAVAAVLDDDRALRPRLDALVTRGLLKPSSSSRYRFRHALLREATYATVTEQDLRTAHRRAAAWLAVHGRDDAEMAEHWLRSGDEPEAASSLLRAARQAIRAGAYRTATHHAERGLGLSVAPTTRGLLHGTATEAWMLQGDNEKALFHGLRALELAPRDSDEWVSAAGITAWTSSMMGDMATVTHQLAEIAEQADDVSLSPAVAVGLYGGVATNVRLGLVEQGRQLFAAFEAKVTPETAPAAAAYHALTASFFALYVEGQLDKAIDWARRCRSLFLEANASTLSVICGNWILAEALAHACSFDEALEVVEDISRIATETATIVTATHVWWVRSLIGANRLDEARAVAARHLGAGRSPATVNQLATSSLLVRAELHLAVANLDAAEALAKEVLELHKGTGPHLAGADAVLARVAQARSQAEEALEHAMRGLGRRSSYPYCRSWLHATRVAALTDLGRDEKAAIARDKAARRVRRIAATLPDGRLRRGYLDYPPHRAVLA